VVAIFRPIILEARECGRGGGQLSACSPAQEPGVEAAACADAALASSAFLVACARWNGSAGADAALFRLSEVPPC